jgi:3-deoxy-D-manno-octulosonic-acid transferase
LRFAYVLLSWLLAPAFVGHLLWRSLRQPSYRRRLPERFGLGFRPLPRPSIVIHAVSVGEVTAGVPMVRALQRRYPQVPIVVTTMTPTGSQRARDLLGDSVVHSYVPYDSTGAVRRFFRWARPMLAIILETEIWPNLYRACGERSIPLVLANARVSVKSQRRYRVLFGLIRDTLSHGIVIGAQSPGDADRFRELGASPERTHVTGNIKFDFDLPAEVPARGIEFRKRHAGARPVWIAASTHEGEEEIALEAHRQLLRLHPNVLLLLVPRHPERFESVAGLLRRLNMPFTSRSSEETCGVDSQVFLGDSMGELTAFYAASDVAFVGGSLVPIGGHNLLEPAALGLPVLTGPYTFNSPDIAELLVEQGAAEIVRSAGDLSLNIARLLGNEAKRRRIGSAAHKAVEENRGALDRLLSLVFPLLDARTTSARH